MRRYLVNIYNTENINGIEFKTNKYATYFLMAFDEENAIEQLEKTFDLPYRKTIDIEEVLDHVYYEIKNE